MVDTAFQGLSIEQLKEKFAGEPSTRLLGFEIAELSPGYAKIVLEVKKEHLNFSGRLFGGITAALADEAFSMAVCSICYPAVGTQLTVYYYAGVGEGDRIFAECRVAKSGKRLGFVEVTITDQKGNVVARAQGSYVPLTK